MESAIGQTTIPVGCAGNQEKVTGDHLTQQCRLVLENSNLGFWTWNLQTGEYTFNQCWPAMLGYSTDELQPRYSVCEELLHPQDLAPWRTAIQHYCNGQTPGFNKESRFRKKNGGWKWISTQGTIVERDDQQKPLRLAGIHIDIHEGKLELESLKQTYASQASFHELISLTLQDIPLEALLSRCLELVFSLPWMSAFESLGALFLINEDDQSLILKAHNNMSADQQKRCALVRCGECFCGQAALTGKPVIARTLAEKDKAADARQHSCGHYCLPLIGSGERVLGVLALCPKPDHEIDLNESAYLIDLSLLMAGLIERKLTEGSLLSESSRLKQLLERLPSLLIGVDINNVIVEWNPAAENLFGIPGSQVLGRILTDCPIPWKWTTTLKNIPSIINRNHPTRIKNIRFTGQNQKDGFLDVTIAPVYDSRHQASRFIILGTDITEYKVIERQLVQSQKLESIGQLAAGIAHEINTPTQYVGDNIRFFQEAFSDLAQLLEKFREAQQACQAGHVPPETQRELGNMVAEMDVEYLMEEIPKAILQSLEGVERVTTIVRAMKGFAHPDASQEKSQINLNQAIENTVTVARNEWKYVAEMALELDSDLPLVPCLAGEFNQVILNIIVNAAHAIGEFLGEKPTGKGRITITTQSQEGWAEIRLSDTGGGIPENIQDKIFDPFFTTKKVGHGTGQGLSICRSVVVDKHGGTLHFETTPGQGTTFVIRLPLEAKALEAVA